MKATSVAKHRHDRPGLYHGAFATRTLDRLVRENVLRYSANILVVILHFAAD